MSAAAVHRLDLLHELAADRDGEFTAQLTRLLEFGCAAFACTAGYVVRDDSDEDLIEAAFPALPATDRAIPAAHCRSAVRQQSGALFLTAEAAADGITAYLGVPISLPDRRWGTLDFIATQAPAAPPTADDLRFLELLAHWLASRLADGEREDKARELYRLGQWQGAILESTTYSVIATDPGGVIVSFNRAAERLLGYRAKEMIGRCTPALIHDPAEITARAQSLSRELGRPIAPGFEVFIARASGGEVEEHEWTYVRKDGSRFPVLLSVSPLHDRAGTVHGYLGIGRDVTADRALREQVEQQHGIALGNALVSAIPDAIVGFDPLPPCRIRFLNPAAERLLGVNSGEALTSPLEQLLQQVERGPETPDLFALPSGQPLQFDTELSTLGTPTPFPAAVGHTRFAFGGSELSVLAIKDMRRRRAYEQRLRLSARVFEYSAEAIMVTDGNSVILNVNPAFTWLTGYRPDEVIGRKPSLLKSGRHDEAFYREMWQTLLTTGHWEGEIWDRHKSGRHFLKWSTINAVREGEDISHFVALFSDLSERKENENRIRHLAQHDHLTGLPNRLMLTEQLSRLVTSERRSESRLALLLLDLDRFKNVNDTFGHQAGDQVLIEVAKRLADCVRTSDLVARLGGDEFVVVLPGLASEEQVTPVVRKIHGALGRPIVIDGRPLLTPPSIGIAFFPDDAISQEGLLQKADAAMYQVKNQGRNSWAFYRPQMEHLFERRNDLENDLRDALRNGKLELFFQPQFDLRDGSITVWEALLRWQHPEHGWVMPEQIIALAEDCGLSAPLGEWVLQNACRQTRRWQDEGLGHFCIGVNISARQLRQPDFIEMVAGILVVNDLEPIRLELEIKEAALLGNCATTLQILARLKAMGIRLVLDDFGTGHSSLSYLGGNAIDRIKIDRSFVRNLAAGEDQAAVVRAIIALAQAFDIGIVAEGVETDLQQQFLSDHGCRHTQGFLRGAPMPATEVAAFLHDQS
jgi:diguanylate cyclase (GGDEF)-like protein/PAS domain S-box-containing protein